MPNFNYTAGASFKPYTFEEMLKPLAMYTTEYNTIQEGISELSTKADVFDKLANEQTDPNAYKMYKTYANDLLSQAESLSKEGLTPASRQGLLNMKRRYSKEITPIETAYAKRSKLAEEQRKLRASNPSIMFDRDFSTTSLDALLDNPELSYTSVSGDDLYKKGKEAAVAASSRLLEAAPALGGQYWKIRQGYGAEAANKFLLDHSNIPELKDAINRIVSQSGVTKDNMNRAIDYTISGIMSGLSYNEKYQADRSYIDAADAERIALAKEQAYGTVLPNGDRIKDIGGGRVRVVHPDGKVEIMAAPKSESSSGSGRKVKPFQGLQFKMWNNAGATNKFQEGLSNRWTYKREGFTTGDEEKVDYTELSKAMQVNLAGELAKYGKTLDDVEIWRDHDFGTDDHYQVRLKEVNTQEPNTGAPDVPDEFGKV